MSVAVTGGAGGLGMALGRAFAERGQAVALLDSSDAVGAAAAATAGEVGGAHVVGVRCDLRSSDDVLRAWEEAESLVGPFDVIVNNAGRFVSSTTAELGDEAWSATIDINLTAPFFMCREVARRWPRAGIHGAIINISSTAALTAQPAGSPDYGASKAGLLGLTVHLAVELGPHGIRTNAILPSSFFSPINRERLKRPEEMERSKRMIPLGRIAEPEEVAAVAVFVALDGSYLNGAMVPCDGGNLVQM